MERTTCSFRDLASCMPLNPVIISSDAFITRSSYSVISHVVPCAYVHLHVYLCLKLRNASLRHIRLQFVDNGH